MESHPRRAHLPGQLERSIDRVPRELHPSPVGPPRERGTRREALRQAAQGREPPGGLQQHVRGTLRGGVAQLPPDAEQGHGGQIRPGAADQHAPELVPGVQTLTPALVAIDARHVMTHGQIRLEPDREARGVALQGIVRLLIHMPKNLGKPAS